MHQPKIGVTRKGATFSEKYGNAEIHWLVSKAANGARELTMGQTSIEVGGCNPLHIHPNCEEALFVLRGRIEHVIEGSPNLPMGPGDAILVPRGLKHQAINVGDEVAELLVAFSSAERQTVLVQKSI